MVSLGNEWAPLLAEEFEKPYYLRLRKLLAQEYRRGPVYPPMGDIFNALRLTSYSAVRAVILGQDPYHGAGQAHGLAFSVQKGVPVPPSLQNIFRELQADIGFTPPGHGCLTEWAQHGVLLLNATLTVRAGQANSHRELGWTTFTDRVIELLGAREEPMAFLLWGSYARAKAQLITGAQHLVLSAAHPSPLSASGGFFGCRHFSKANLFLSRFGREVDWSLQP